MVLDPGGAHLVSRLVSGEGDRGYSPCGAANGRLSLGGIIRINGDDSQTDGPCGEQRDDLFGAVSSPGFRRGSFSWFPKQPRVLPRTG